MAVPATAEAGWLRRAGTVPASGTAAAPAASASSRAFSVIGLRSARLNPARAIEPAARRPVNREPAAAAVHRSGDRQDPVETQSKQLKDPFRKLTRCGWIVTAMPTRRKLTAAAVGNPYSRSAR